MEKNWLIRTKSNHILGPISKEKLQELYRNGSVKPDDEICSGNGFWFFIRENDLVEKFLLGNHAQSFNPISEAKDVLNKSEHPETNAEDQSELSDITLVGGIKVPSDINSNGSQETKSDRSLEENPVGVEVDFESLLKKSKKEKKISNLNIPQIKKTSVHLKKHGFLKWLGIIGFVVLFCLIYFRKRIIRSLFEDDYSMTHLSPVSLVYAQEISEKKKI